MGMAPSRSYGFLMGVDFIFNIAEVIELNYLCRFPRVDYFNLFLMPGFYRLLLSCDRQKLQRQISNSPCSSSTSIYALASLRWPQIVKLLLVEHLQNINQTSTDHLQISTKHKILQVYLQVVTIKQNVSIDYLNLSTKTKDLDAQVQ